MGLPVFIPGTLFRSARSNELPAGVDRRWGEGLSLQFCHVMINYDISWKPMELEQRIGRVDSIRQAEAAVAENFVGRETVEQSAREHGKAIYHELVHAHRSDVSARRARGEYSFVARRRSFARIGLPAVRNHRLAQLATEEQSWRAAIDREAEVSPDLVPLIIVSVDPNRWLPVKSWRDAILKEFTPQVARLTLASDPDALLREEGILKEIAERGFELMPFDDHVAFRFAYESRYRSRWDRGDPTDLVVVLRAGVSHMQELPNDVLQKGRLVSFTLGDLFPNLSNPVVDTLERSHLDALYEAQTREPPPRPLGDVQTCGFVLRHVFGIAPETIRQEPDLFQFLLRRHYGGLRIPPMLDNHLFRLLSQNPMFAQWPLHEILSDREVFFAFLQERWPSFLDRQTSDGRSIREPAVSVATESLRFPGPIEFPFQHRDLRVYLDNLFLEGFLEPVPHPNADRLTGSWAIAGIKTDPAADLKRRLEGLLTVVEQSFPDKDARHQGWLTFARRWAQVNALVFGGDRASVAEDTLSRYRSVRDRIDMAFTAWLKEHFGTLHNQPPLPPVLTHHVPRMLARTLEESADAKVAMVLMDGLSLDQWATVRGVLADQRPSLRFREDALLAWIPTLTMVSRQACFSGRLPLYFPASIHTTDRERSAWQRFWLNEGLPAAAVDYAKNLRDHPDLNHVAELVSHHRIRALGLVVDAVDRIMHGMMLGQPGMHNQVRQWTGHGFLAALLDLLIEHGFTIFLTSDHGNIETRGCGRPAEGSAADLRGERVRVFPDPALRAKVKERFPDSIEWPPLGLPDDYFALIAPGRSSFVRPSERPVAHGGITLEEVVVPLIQIDRE